MQGHLQLVNNYPLIILDAQPKRGDQMTEILKDDSGLVAGDMPDKDELVYNKNGITITQKELMDAMPSPLTVPPSGLTADEEYKKIYNAVLLGLVIKKAKELPKDDAGGVKPCLCGIDLWHDEPNGYYIHPANDNCVLGDMILIDYSGEPEEEKKLIALWNNRPIEDALRVQVSRAETIIGKFEGNVGIGEPSWNADILPNIIRYRDAYRDETEVIIECTAALKE